MWYHRPAPPLIEDPEESARWTETRRRRLMLYGAWRELVVERIRQQLSYVRAEAIGEPDLSSNVFASVASSLATLYDEAPTVAAPAGGERLAEMVAEAGYWAMAQRLQRDTLGLREMLVRVSAVTDPGGPRLHYRPVYPDMVLALPDMQDPSRPVEIRELQLRHGPDGRAQWTWEVCSIVGGVGVHRVVSAEGADLSLWYLGVEGGLVGEAYPWQSETGPILPYVLYHAAQTGCLWDPYELRELVDGTLTAAVHWTFYGHCLRSASWPQRYMLDCEPIGASLTQGETDARRSALEADPAVVLLLRATGEGQGQPLIGQWQAAADPSSLQEAIALYERRVAARGGIAPGDIQRVSGDPRSGYALAITHSAQRAAQRRYAPTFGRGDLELLRVSAVVARQLGIEAPETGYRVSYVAVPTSPEERQAEREQADWDLAHGHLSPVDLYLRDHPGMDPADAEAALAHNRGASATSSLQLDAATLAAVVTVDEARASVGLPPATAGGTLTVEAYRDQHAAVDESPPTEVSDDT